MRMRNGFRKTMQKRDLGLAKRSNAPLTGPQGLYTTNGQFRNLLGVSLKQAEIQKAGI